jgi:O-antigen/teichoic acid export membrane protein
LEVVLDWLDVLLVAALRSASEAGVYAVVTRLARAGLIVDSAARVAVAPRMASLLDRGEHQRASDLFAGLAGLAMFVSWPAYLTVIAYAPTVLGWFGPDFSTGQTALRIVAAAMMVVLSAGIVQTMLLMGGRSHYQLANKAVALVVNLVANLLLIPRMGISGAALAWLVTLLVDTAMASWQVRHGFQVSLRLRSLIPVGGVALTAGGGALALARLWGQGTAALAVTTVVVAAGYLALSWRLRDRLGWRELRML